MSSRINTENTIMGQNGGTRQRSFKSPLNFNKIFCAPK